MIRRMIVPVFVFLLALFALTASAQGISFSEVAAPALAWDAVPSPDGSTIYYTALQPDGLPAVLSVPAAGGDSMVLASGLPFALPLALDISSDGQTLYVGDPLLNGTAGDAIFAVPTRSKMAVVPVVGTQGTAPQSVTVVSEDGADQIYYAGVNPANGHPAIYKIAARGAGDATIIAEGAPLIAPSGIAVAKDGTIYVVDRLASGDGIGTVLRVSGGSVETIASDVRTGGQVAGAALTLDNSTLLVSSLDTAAGTAQVLAINLGNMQASIINDVIKANNGALGLHRAHEVNIFGWAGYSDFPMPIQKPGHVYVVRA